MNYDRDYTRLAMMLLPVCLRLPGLVALMQSSNSYLQQIHAELMQLKADLEYKLGHSAQVCYLEGAINDALDVVDRRIYIADSEATQALVVLLSADVYNQPVLLNADAANLPILLNADSIYQQGDYDFKVIVPFVIDNNQLYQLRALLNYYKLAGMRYQIIQQ